MTARRLFGQIHRALASHPQIVRFAVKVRNQANAVVATHFSGLSASSDSRLNGENHLIELIAPGAANFIDVGGNRGDWTAYFTSCTGKPVPGLIYEPHVSCVEELRRRFASHSDDLEIIHAAVSDFSGVAHFFESAANDQLSSLISTNAGQSSVRRAVAVVTLDDEMTRRRWERISFLKIDTEGNDYFVLRGSRRLLQERRIDVVQFECNSTWAATGIRLRAAIELLKSNGYETVHLRSEGLFHVDLDFFGDDLGYGNWVAFHRGSADRLRPLLRS